MNYQSFDKDDPNTILLKNVKLANEVLQQAAKWNQEALDAQSQAKKERDSVESAKKNRWLLPLISLLAILVNPLIGIIAFIVVTIIVWLPKNSPKAHLKRAEQLEADSQRKKRLIDRFLQEHAHELDIIPRQYLRPVATQFFVDAIQTGKALSLPSAIDQFEDWFYKEKAAVQKRKEEEQIRQQKADKRAKATVAGIGIGVAIFSILWDIISPNKNDDYLYDDPIDDLLDGIDELLDDDD